MKATETRWLPADRLDLLGQIGTLLLPGPGLGEYAWMRRRAGATARFSLCGVTHTTATARVLDDLAALLVAPGDAVGRAGLHLARGRAHGRARARRSGRLSARALRRRAPAPPLLPMIPLGVHCDDFARDPVLRAVVAGAPRPWRRRRRGAVPRPPQSSMPRRTRSRCIRRCSTRPRPAPPPGSWCSPAGSPTEIEAAFRAAADAFCPDVRAIVLDATRPDQRRAAWALADLFVSPSDNIQETFGLAPMEAMAAGLPVRGQRLGRLQGHRARRRRRLPHPHLMRRPTARRSPGDTNPPSTHTTSIAD